jgi:hypothetical protein
VAANATGARSRTQQQPPLGPGHELTTSSSSAAGAAAAANRHEATTPLPSAVVELNESTTASSAVKGLPHLCEGSSL